MNADGYDDMVIGATCNGDGGEYAGAAYLVLGGSAPGSASLSAAIQFTGEASRDFAGSTVSGAGDVDADGFDDFVVGAHGAASTAGATFLVLGSADPSPASLGTATKYTGETAGDLAGGYGTISGGGDLDGDGYDDFVVGAMRNGDAGAYAGAAYLIFGTGW